MTFTHALSTNNYGPCKFIVATSAANGTHTTLAAALAAASSGDTVFLRDSVTENVTLPAGVNIACWTGSNLNTPTIIGKITMTAAGTSTISGIQLQTNSDNCVAVTGSSASIVRLYNCFINCTNNTGLLNSSSSGNSLISLFFCKGDIGTTGIALFANSGSGSIFTKGCHITNTGASTTANTCSGSSSGALMAFETQFNLPLTISSSASVLLEYCNLNTLTSSSTSNATLYYCFGGDIVVGSGTTITLAQCVLSSSTTNVISGAGTVIYSDLSFVGSGFGISATTQTYQTTNLAKYQAPGQPSFCVYNLNNITSVTGDGTAYTVNFDTELSDVGNNFASNTFTAPVTGNYLLTGNVNMYNLGAAHTQAIVSVVTTSNTFIVGYQNSAVTRELASGNNILAIPFSIVVPMSATNTALIQLTVSGSTKTVNLLGSKGCFFSGQLLS